MTKTRLPSSTHSPKRQSPSSARLAWPLFLAAAALIALLLVAVCDSGKLDADGNPVVEPAPSGQAQEPAAEPLRRAPERPERPERPAAPAAEKSGPIRLAGGGTLTVPDDAKPTTAPGGIPEDVARSMHAFRLPGGNRRLMVSEIALSGQTCGDRLDEEWERLQTSRRETDPKKLELRRTTKVEDRRAGGRRVIYSESMQGTSLADAGAPFAATVSALFCVGGDFVLLMYMATEADVAPEVRELIEAILKSVRDPGAASDARPQGASR